MRRLTVMLLVSDLRQQGGERQVLDLARGLDKDRFRVLLTMLSSDAMWDAGLAEVKGIELRSLEWRGKRDPTAVLRLVSFLRQEQVDVIQSLSAPATALALSAAIIARTPVRIVAERAGVPSGDRFHRYMAKRLMRFADAVITDSDVGARQLRTRGVAAGKVHVIYDGVSPDRVRTHRAERDTVRSELGVLDESWLIGVQTNLTPETDHGNFLQAASIVRAEVPGTKFMVVGDGPMRSEVTRRATILGLDGSLILAGHQPRTAPYIGAMDVAVLPPGNPEGSADFGLAAMGLGRPIVATDVGANSELFAFGEVGFVVPPNNPIILAHAILEVMRHPEAVERMRARGRKVFDERFTLERMVSEYDDLYGNLWRNYQSKHRRAEAEPASS